ncbi:hypothetical protein BAX94_14170 [Elizabethkingia meningoseptica]|uniref:Uncharacterized protein n=1 Tax=Elizabethkingia meningoseptica TaxID=238 RepID=A0A1V3TYC8_ELIME|nr:MULTISPECIES: hypothetical protein [Elizabethkingia]AQX05695.1 hypothetical protein BBD33_10745 [Elizabethkingia meningoseptica]AQX13243.1 hypothetical protein BBD35_13065 [Elizabethkingia meningoseptica]AQX47738.1 hypothetical protein B5G46_10735 [Elizabethkingia meningoseptica]KUY23999.1 hypothetical protein ATB99_00375 [Elizabethkingia meningoseptica]MBG0514870.1 hypothetical protein [Elizabethkingia meningoseptica]
MNKVVLLLLFAMLFSCSINQRDTNKQRHGYWQETKPTFDGYVTTKGRYKHGEQVGKWKYSFGDTLYQRDKIRKKMIITHYFYPDKTIMARGQSRLDITKDGKRHWYKFGPWYEYDKNGNLLWIKYYKDGNLYQYQENGIMKYDVKKFF